MQTKTIVSLAGIKQNATEVTSCGPFDQIEFSAEPVVTFVLSVKFYWD